MESVIMNKIKLPVNKHLFLFFLFLCLLPTLYAQPSRVDIYGRVLEKTKSGDEMPVMGVKISRTKKEFTFTDKDGKFVITVPDTTSYLWSISDKFGIDTLRITDKSKEIKLVYPYVQSFKDIKITKRRPPTEMSLLTMQKTEFISSKELLKAACCNLSESFETTPSVDVAFSDAVTGFKQIQLLGLSGPHTLITRENIPDTRGLASITGLTFTPGTWIEGMQLSKGTGSVVNGYEGLAGQINIEWRKPMDGDKQYYNIYQSAQGRSEANAYVATSLKPNLHTGLFFHAKSQWLKVDQNHDHFIDQPLGNSIIAANRWFWFGKKGEEFQFGIKYTFADNLGGSMHGNIHESPSTSASWRMNLSTQRFDAWSKIGKVFTAKPWKSMGLQLNFSNHEQQSQFGRRLYNAHENTLYANYIFQSILKNTNRIIKFGFSASHMQRNETVLIDNYKQNETTAGIFSEYAHTFSKKLNALIGLRADYHNRYGVFLTPRFHLRYAPFEKLAIRASIGKATRTASIFSENLGLFSTNRTILIMPSQSDGLYQLQAEKGINTGINAVYKFDVNYQAASLSLDYYYTRFLNQVVVDWEDAQFVKFYNSTAPSYAHSAQVQLDISPIRKFDIRLAYRFHDIRTTYENTLRQKPLNAKHRAFINLAYTTRSKWSVDYTVQWTGPKRIPSTTFNPSAYQLPQTSPSFITMNAQISKAFPNLELYAGVENITNIMQQNPIIQSNNPFGTYFDASLVWGPAMGRTIYGGLRFHKK